MSKLCYTLLWNLVTFILISNTFSDSCIIEIRHTGYHVKFGHQIPIWNFQACNLTCLQNSSCIGFDWDSNNPGCFLFINYLEENATKMSGVDHYYFLREDSLCSGNVQYESWKPKINKSFNGGVKELSYSDDLGACVDSCLNDVYCKAVDWNQSENGCSIIKNTNGGSLVDDLLSYHYDRLFIPNEPISTNLTSSVPTSSSPEPFTVTGLDSTTPFLNILNSTTVPNINTVTLIPNFPSNTVTTAVPLSMKPTLAPLIPPLDQPSFNIQTTAMYSASNSVDRSAPDTLAIRPAYIVIIGLGLGCVALTITAVTILCLYPLRRKVKNNSSALLTDEPPTKSKLNDSRDSKDFATIKSKNRFATISSVQTDFENPAFRDMEVVETEHHLDEIYANGY